MREGNQKRGIGGAIKALLAPFVKDTKYEHCRECDELAKLLDQRKWRDAYITWINRLKGWIKGDQG